VLARGGRPPLRRRPAALLAVGAARLLARLPPYRIGQVLRLIRRGAEPATEEEAADARSTVTAASRHCRGPQGCLPRSLATAVLCRLRGVWPTWCTGVRTTPFAAHAWVEVAGRPVGEPHPPDYYAPVLTVPPRGATPAQR
jgi:hypothetical protein